MPPGKEGIMTHVLSPKSEVRQKWGAWGLGGRQNVQSHSVIKGEYINDADRDLRLGPSPDPPFTTQGLSVPFLSGP